ncbi:MAG: hypothetical protein OK455_00135 [Thaumarchaeota archaeon]|nr:hypothetical protein [Nitrososphaerota archaeon]
MKIDTNKLQVLTAAAILVLISGGIAAYAQDQANSSSSTSTSSSSISNSTSATSSTSTSASTSTSTEKSAVTTTATTTTAASTPTALCTPPTAAGQVGKLTLPISPSQSQSQAGTIVFSGDHGCVASITTVGGIFNVAIQLRYAKPVTQYVIVLVANGTSHTLGDLVTGQDGTGAAQNQVLLTPGTYVVSIQIFDASSTPGQNTLVMQSSSGTITSPTFPTPSSHQQTKQGDDDHGN